MADLTQNVIERSDSVDAQNSGCGSGVRGSAENLCRLGSTERVGTVRIPPRCELNYLAGALATSRRNEHPVATLRTPPSVFTSAVNRAVINADAMELGTFACAKTGGCLVQEFKSVFLVHHDLEVFMTEPAWPWRRTRGAVLRLCKNLSRSNSNGDSVLGRVEAEVATPLEGACSAVNVSAVSRCQSGTGETLSSSGHFSQLHCTASRHCSLFIVRSWCSLCGGELVMAATALSHNVSQ